MFGQVYCRHGAPAPTWRGKDTALGPGQTGARGGTEAFHAGCSEGGVGEEGAGRLGGWGWGKRLDLALGGDKGDDQKQP